MMGWQIHDEDELRIQKPWIIMQFMASLQPQLLSAYK